MEVELWTLLSVVIALLGIIVVIAIFLWNKVSKLEDRLRKVEIDVARLDERTRLPVAYGEEIAWRVIWSSGEEREE